MVIKSKPIFGTYFVLVVKDWLLVKIKYVLLKDIFQLSQRFDQFLNQPNNCQVLVLDQNL
jgi:hypothetical protein